MSGVIDVPSLTYQRDSIPTITSPAGMEKPKLVHPRYCVFCPLVSAEVA